jgi:hypothetical protein
MAAEVLSDLLRTVRLTGAAFFDVLARAPWVAEQPPREMVLAKILPGAEHLIAYHVITEGHSFASLVGGEPIGLAAGEIIVFTKGDPHVMASSPGMRANPVAPAALKRGHRQPVAVLTQLWRRRAGLSEAHLRLARLRCPPFQSAAREPATGYQGRRPHGPYTLAWRADASCDNRIGGPAPRRRNRLGQTERVAVHRGGSPASGGPAAGTGGMASRSARPIRRQGVGADTRSASAELDDRGAGQESGAVALGASGAFRRPSRDAADALSGQMADADRGWSAEREQRRYCHDCCRNWLWIRGGF